MFHPPPGGRVYSVYCKGLTKTVIERLCSAPDLAA